MKKILLVSASYLAGLVMVGTIAWLDSVTNTKISFYLIYFPAIMLVAWFGGRTAGIIMSLVCSGAWVWAAWPTLASTSVPIRIVSILIHVFAMSFVAWMTVVLGQGKILRDAFQKKQGEQLDIEIGFARQDYLTGALNSRAFEEKMTEIRSLAKRYGHSTSLLYIDLDFFKEINDKCGHLYGDEMLQKTVSGIKASVRNVDLTARLGGDEFVVLMPETTEPSARISAERILSHLKKKIPSPLSASIGVTSFSHDNKLSNTKIIKIADDAMYQAKRAGRNRFVVVRLTEAVAQ